MDARFQSNPEAALDVAVLSKQYADLLAVTSLSFSVSRGEILGLVGPNGAGKTTTLRCLAGIIPPSSGTIRISGHDLLKEPVLAKRALAFLPDEPKLFEYLTVWEHLNLTARLYGVLGWEIRARHLLSELELKGKENSLPGEISRGMKQKLSIACAFLHEPAVILLDEPLTGLDPLGIRKMKNSLRARSENGGSILLSSHLLPLVEELCHRILVIARGQLVALGTIDEIRARITASGASSDSTSLEDLFVQITSADQSKG